MTPSIALDLSNFFPTNWPEPNALMVFGVLLSFGVLGGLVAARARWLPSITGFMLFGLAVGPSGLGLLSQSALTGARFLVDIALGLILFKLGASLHPIRAARNRKLVVTSLAEGLATFAVILGLMLLINAPLLVAVLVAAIAVSSSPAVLIHVAEEMHARGPTLDNAKALVAANNLLSFILFSLALPVALMQQQVGVETALLLPLYQMAGAVLVALLVAALVTMIARLTRGDEKHFRFALVVGAVMLTLGLAHALKVSSLFAGLTLGLACRWLQGRTRLARVDFGGGGDVFFVILFVFAGASLHLKEVITYAPVALAFVAARSLAKVGAVYATGVAYDGKHRQALATGLLLVPMSGLAIGLVQTTTELMPELGGRVAAIVFGAVAVFETIGPPIAAMALRLCGASRAAAPSAHPSPTPADAAATAKPAAGTAPAAVGSTAGQAT